MFCIWQPFWHAVSSTSPVTSSSFEQDDEDYRSLYTCLMIKGATLECIKALAREDDCSHFNARLGTKQKHPIDITPNEKMVFIVIHTSKFLDL